MHDATAIPIAPAPLGLLLRSAPLLPLRIILQRMAKSMAARRPDLFLRLEQHARKSFLIDPVDLPFVFRLQPRPDRPSIEPRRRGNPGPWDARIAGPLAALVGMVHGTYDGDALFFSRDVTIEGDTEAVVALRNALDDAEIDLLTEASLAFGPAGTALDRVVRPFLPFLSRSTGLALTRDERFGE